MNQNAGFLLLSNILVVVYIVYSATQTLCVYRNFRKLFFFFLICYSKLHEMVFKNSENALLFNTHSLFLTISDNTVIISRSKCDCHIMYIVHRTLYKNFIIKFYVRYRLLYSSSSSLLTVFFPNVNQLELEKVSSSNQQINVYTVQLKQEQKELSMILKRMNHSE